MLAATLGSEKMGACWGGAPLYFFLGLGPQRDCPWVGGDGAGLGAGEGGPGGPGPFSSPSPGLPPHLGGPFMRQGGMSEGERRRGPSTRLFPVLFPLPPISPHGFAPTPGERWCPPFYPFAKTRKKGGGEYGGFLPGPPKFFFSLVYTSAPPVFF